MKIIAIHDGGSGCMFYRIRTPLEALAANGYDVTFLGAGAGDGPRYFEPPRYGRGVKIKRASAVLSELEGYDLIIGQRLNQHAGLETWRRVRGPFSRLVYETDDDVFTVGPENWAAYHTFGRGDVRDAVMHASEVADLITVSTRPLATVMGQFNANTVVIGNCLPDWVPQMTRKPHARPCIGWAGGASHGLDVGLIVEPVRAFLARFTGWDFRLGGSDFRATFACPRVYHRRWIPVNANPRSYYATMRMDIGLAPLVPGAFNNSRSYIKVLEYAALGIPSVASATGPYPDFIRHGHNGFLADGEDEWLHYMSLLASDEQLREKLGAAAREDALLHTIGCNWTKWANAYDALFRRQSALACSGWKPGDIRQCPGGH